MKIVTVSHRGLKRLLEEDDERGIDSRLASRVRNILAALVSATDMAGVRGPPGWRIHQLRGDRAGTWSISISGNWRITFDLEEDEIRNLDLEDYH
jgi:proteic killer suppression protein